MSARRLVFRQRVTQAATLRRAHGLANDANLPWTSWPRSICNRACSAVPRPLPGWRCHNTIAAVAGQNPTALAADVEYPSLEIAADGDKNRNSFYHIVEAYSRMKHRKGCSESEYRAFIVEVGSAPGNFLPLVVLEKVFRTFVYCPRSQPDLQDKLLEACILKLDPKHVVGNSMGHLSEMFFRLRDIRRVRPQTLNAFLNVVYEGLITMPPGSTLPDKVVARMINGLKSFDIKNYNVLQLLTAVSERIALESSPERELSEKFISDVVYGLHNFSADLKVVQDILVKLSSRLNSSQLKLSPKTLSSVMFGMQTMKNDNPAVAGMLQALVSKVNTTDPMSSREIGMTLCGLRSMNSDGAAVRSLLHFLTIKLTENPIPFSRCGTSFSSSLYGLQGMSSSVPEVERLVDAIVEKALASRMVDLNDQGLAAAFYGIRSMTASSTACRRLLGLLGDLIADYKYNVTQETLASILQGLRNFSSDTVEVRRIASVLAKRLNREQLPTSRFTAKGMSLSINGLKSFSSDSPEVLELVSELAHILKEMSTPFTEYNFSRLLAGMSGMRCDTPETEFMFTVISDKLAAVEGDFDGSDFSNALSGLSSANCNHPAIASLLSRITAMGRSLIERGDIGPPIELARSLYDMRNMSSDNELVTELIKVMAERIRMSKAEWNDRQISNALFGLSNMRSNSKAVLSLLLSLRLKLKQYRGGFKTPQALSMSFYGLHNLESRVTEVSLVVEELGNILQRNQKLSLGSWELMNAFYGLKSMRSDSSAITEVLSMLTGLLYRSTDDLTPAAFAGILKGMNGMSSTCPEVVRLVGILANKLFRCRGEFSSMELGSCLYGLQSMRSDVKEVNMLLAALELKITNSKQEFSSKFFASGLYGLRNMNSEDETVCSLLRAITAKLVECRDTFTSQNIGNVMYGMQNMSSDSEAVRALLDAVNVKIREADTTPMTTQGLGNALYGLQNMNSDSPEVREFLVLMRDKMKRPAVDDASMNPQEVGNAIYGMRNISYRTLAVPDILEFLYTEARYCLDLFRAIPSFNWERWIRSLMHSIMLTVPYIPYMEQGLRTKFLSTIPDMSKYLQTWEHREESDSKRGNAFSILLERCGPEIVQKAPYKHSSGTEWRIFLALQQRYQRGCRVTVASNHYLHHFESDITLHVCGKWGADVLVNIEVDAGQSHSMLSKQRFHEYRDAFLRDHGVFVVRLSGDDLVLFSSRTAADIVCRLVETSAVPEGMDDEIVSDLLYALCDKSNEVHAADTP